MLACRDGRLRENDRLLAVDGHLLGEKSSLEDAVIWLQQSAGRVTLVVAHKLDVGGPHPLTNYTSLSPASTQSNTGDFTVRCSLLPPLNLRGLI